MQLKKITILTLAVFYFCAVAMATEKYFVSATDGSHLIVSIYKLESNRVRLVRSNTIATGTSFGVFNTAVMSHKQSNAPVFDVYYANCQDEECVNTTLEMIRLDSKLDVQFTRTVIAEPVYWWSYVGLATERVEKKSGITNRILTTNNNNVVERILDPNGMAGSPMNVAFHGNFSATAAEDGKMVVAASPEKILQSRTFHPSGDIRRLSTSDYPYSLSLSGPISTSKQNSKPYRLLFYRVFQEDAQGLMTKIMMQEFDDTTGKSIAGPRDFTKFEPTRYYSIEKSLTVSPKANLVFYTRRDPTCADRKLLWVQVSNPHTFTNIGPAQSLTNCDFTRYAEISGIDVAPLD